ncbi:metal-dependent hydrolase [Arenimonas fontis]|uniref:Metal-dependent hydrolase n=1 Tax=Arenimonas fontis TaxID=2608255 RepID=A0A5B2ZBB5_9GAMM|nr:metal-dependent hydrolase [Arenimonas fontis]KAA2285267.1 metal-dependent hydrolase [Arenimonas fontis]
MDSLTQILLGGSVAAACVPAGHRRAALGAGAVLGTLPDLDSVPMWLLDLDPVTHMTWHRGPSHSLLVLAPLAWLLWAWYRRRGGRVAEAPRAWLAAIALALLTHPLLDAFTVYGTQLFWPLPLPPAMWSSLFIIDPLYTLPLLLAFAWALAAGARPSARTALALGLALSTAYLGWSLAAKALVEREVERSLAGTGLEQAPRFSVPMPFNTLLWRVVVMTPSGFLEGERSLVADRGPMQFRSYPSDAAALAAVADYPAVARLRWFNRGFMKAQLREDRLVLSDLRMGAEPDYSFNFAVARWDGERWREIRPERLAWPWQARRRLAWMWQRIWTAPAGPSAAQGRAVPTDRAVERNRAAPVAQAAAAKSGGTPASSASK